MADEMLIDFLDILRKVAERNLAEIERLIKTFLSVKDELEPITASELTKRIHKREVTVLDVRPFEEFAEGHLPSAINIPLKELEERLKVIPTDKEVIAYCRGPHLYPCFRGSSQAA